MRFLCFGLIFILIVGVSFASSTNDQDNPIAEHNKLPHLVFRSLHLETHKVLYEIELLAPHFVSDKIISMLLYREPSHSLIYAVVAEDAPKEELQMIIDSNPHSFSLSEMVPFKASLLIDSSPNDDHLLVLVVRTQRADVIHSSELMQCHVDFSENFTFSSILDPEGTGCWTWGRCGDGEGFWGPYCDPCDYILCCDGDVGTIHCGSKCP